MTRTRDLPLCATADPDIFFPEGKNAVAHLAQARALCGTCPGALACLNAAIASKEQYGVWGGTLFEDGKIVPEKRRPGRPRKTPVAA